MTPSQTALPFLATSAFSFSVPLEDGQRGFAVAVAVVVTVNSVQVVGAAVIVISMAPLSLRRPVKHDPKQTRNEDLNTIFVICA